MEEPIEQRSVRSRKPKVHYDDLIAQSSGPSKPSTVRAVALACLRHATQPRHGRAESAS
jgi:hypothetical protein